MAYFAAGGWDGFTVFIELSRQPFINEDDYTNLIISGVLVTAELYKTVGDPDCLFKHD